MSSIEPTEPEETLPPDARLAGVERTSKVHCQTAEQSEHAYGDLSPFWPHLNFLNSTFFGSDVHH